MWSNGSNAGIYVADSTATELIESNTNVRGYIPGTTIEYIYSESTASFDVLTEPTTLRNTTTQSLEYSSMFIAFGTEAPMYMAEVANGTLPAILPANDGNVTKAPEIIRFGPTSNLQLSRNQDFWSTNASYTIGLFSNPSLIVDEYEDNKVLRINEDNFLTSEVTNLLPGINGRGVFTASNITVQQKLYQTIIDLGATEITVDNNNATYNFIGIFKDDLIIYGGYTDEARQFTTEVFNITKIDDWLDGVVII